MHDRLKPVNALLGLCIPGDLNPPVLHDAGFRIAGLEIPVLTPTGRVVIDVLLVHPETSRLVLCESKSGANIDAEQARKYAALDPRNVVLAGSVDLPTRTPPSVETLYLCLEPHSVRVLKGLAAADVDMPVMVAAARSISLLNREHASPLLAGALGTEPVELPTGIGRHVVFDEQSTAGNLQQTVRAQLAALQSNKIAAETVRVIAAGAVPQLAVYGKGAREGFVRKAAAAARAIADAEPDTFAYQSATGHHEALVRVLRTPEGNDPRGRTQAWQANGRPRHTQRRREPDPNQMDLLRELDVTDDVGGDSDTETEQEADA